MKATMTSKGQVTIPMTIRSKAHLVPGSKLDFQIDDNGIITIQPLTRDISELKGIVKSKRKSPASLKEMKIAIKRGASKRLK